MILIVVRNMLLTIVLAQQKYTIVTICFVSIIKQYLTLILKVIWQKCTFHLRIWNDFEKVFLFFTVSFCW
jgi:hypothetical protein